MKFGVREICDVVLKAKATQKVGNKTFYKGEPVIYFDTLKTSSLEGAATTTYATGGRGNSRLMAWEGERTLTFNMEDALISPIGFMILSGAGLIEASKDEKIFVHTTETTSYFKLENDELTIYLQGKPAKYDESNVGVNKLANNEDYIYVMTLDENGEVVSEPFIPYNIADSAETDGDYKGKYAVKVKVASHSINERDYEAADLNHFMTNVKAVLVDYYVEKTGNAQQIEITPDKFGGNYYLEASTLFRNTAGVDMPAEFIIPNCKIQSNFTFSMTSSGDPSTFNFVMDAFPDYTRFDATKKVLAAIQIITSSDDDENNDNERRVRTHHEKIEVPAND